MNCICIPEPFFTHNLAALLRASASDWQLTTLILYQMEQHNGQLPADDDYICAILGIRARRWEKYKEKALRPIPLPCGLQSALIFQAGVYTWNPILRGYSDSTEAVRKRNRQDKTPPVVQGNPHISTDFAAESPDKTPPFVPTPDPAPTRAIVSTLSRDIEAAEAAEAAEDAYSPSGEESASAAASSAAAPPAFCPTPRAPTRKPPDLSPLEATARAEGYSDAVVLEASRVFLAAWQDAPIGKPASYYRAICKSVKTRLETDQMRLTLLATVSEPGPPDAPRPTPDAYPREPRTTQERLERNRRWLEETPHVANLP